MQNSVVSYWKKRVAELNKKIEELRREIHESDARNTELLRERDNLQAERNYPRENTLQARNDFLRERNENLQEENTKLQQFIRDSNLNVDNLREEIARLREENDKLAKTAQSFQEIANENAYLASRRLKALSEIEQLKAQNAELRQAQWDTEKLAEARLLKLMQAEETIERIRSENERIGSENDSLRDRLDAIKAALADDVDPRIDF